MLNKAILELNGIFNVNKQSTQSSPQQETTAATATKQFVHPILTKENIRETMSNYRKAVDAYNDRVLAENVTIKSYNKQVKQRREKEPLQMEQKILLSRFYSSIAPLSTWERNERIKHFNQESGMIAEKDKIQTVKFPAEQVFAAILWHYNQQLYKRQYQRIQLDVYVPGKLPYIELHSGWITRAKEDGVVRLKICNRTFRRYRERLEEAGILQDYIFEGSSRPVKMRINPQILTITDNYSSKKAAIKNQCVTSGGRTELPHNNVSNRTDLNKFQIKANVEKHSEERSSATGLTSLNSSSIRNTRKQGEEKKVAAAGEKLSLSQFLRQRIEDKEDFAQDLAAHRFDNYTPLRIEILQKEAYAGTLDRDEFKELVLQDFFKTAAKLWKDKQPYIGSWMKAYNHWMAQKWITPGGLSSNKHNILTRIPELRYRLQSVNRFLKNYEEFNLLFPGDYFDTTRTTAKEGGFEYTRKAWKKHEVYLQSKKSTENKTGIKAKNRKRRLSERQKADKHVRDYLRGKYDLQELFTKVEQLGNKELSAHLPEILKKANLKFQLNQR